MISPDDQKACDAHPPPVVGGTPRHPTAGQTRGDAQKIYAGGGVATISRGVGQDHSDAHATAADISGTLATPPPVMRHATPMFDAPAVGCEQPAGEPTKRRTTPTSVPSAPQHTSPRDRAITRPTPNRRTPDPEEPIRTPQPASDQPMPMAGTRAAEYAHLNLPLLSMAESLHDLERTRIATANRLRQLRDSNATDVELTVLATLAADLEQVEHQLVLAVQRAMRKHPLGAWVKRSKGVGEKQAARMLAAIGDPYWNAAVGRPRRGPAELWAYCGYHVVEGQSPRRRKGQRANWNDAARMRTYLVAVSCMKSSGEYRAIYEAGRERYAALPAGHAHNRALRLVSKAILRDVYLEAKAWHEAALDGSAD